jgi:hypothetical protein
MNTCNRCKNSLHILRPQRDTMDAVARCSYCGALHVLDAEPSTPHCPAIIYNALEPEHQKRLRILKPFRPAKNTNNISSLN